MLYLKEKLKSVIHFLFTTNMRLIINKKSLSGAQNTFWKIWKTHTNILNLTHQYTSKISLKLKNFLLQLNKVEK